MTNGIALRTFSCVMMCIFDAIVGTDLVICSRSSWMRYPAQLLRGIRTSFAAVELMPGVSVPEVHK